MFSFLRERIIWARTADFVARYRPQLVGITGSTGKTITRDAIALALGTDIAMRVAEKSYDTPLDTALAILGIDRNSSRATWFKLLTNSLIKEIKVEEPETIVVELGAHRPGDIDTISQRLAFRVLVVTNVGTTHTELFYNKDMVAHELTSAVVTLGKGSVAILNADDPQVAAMVLKARGKVVTYGMADGADVRIVRIDRVASGLGVTVRIGGTSHELHLPYVIERHHVGHVVAALACAQVLGVDVAAAAKRLQGFVPPAGRMRRLAGRNGAIILDDSYSASPEVTAAALNTLKALNAGRKIAVLGDMTGLGGLSRKAHADIGRTAAGVADMVIAVGEEMREAGKEALRLGKDVHHFMTADEVGKWLVDFLQPDDVVLVAGSRVMHMEQVVARLLADPAKDGNKLVSAA